MSIYTTNNRLKQILETTRGSTLGMGGITLFIVVLMIFFAVLPAYRSITDQLKNNEAKTVYFDALQKKKTVLDKLAFAYKENQEVINYFDLYNNPVRNTETFVANIDAIAKKHDGILVNINLENGTNYKSPDNSPFTTTMSMLPQKLQMQFRVKLASVTYLINSLEEFPLTIYISTINVTQTSVTGNSMTKGSLSSNDTVEVSIIGETYFWNNAQ
jgi:hypothetical protein